MILQKIKGLLEKLDDPNTRKRTGACMAGIPILLWLWVACEFNILAVIVIILFLVTMIFGLLLLFADD